MGKQAVRAGTGRSSRLLAAFASLLFAPCASATAPECRSSWLGCHALQWQTNWLSALSTPLETGLGWSRRLLPEDHRLHSLRLRFDPHGETEDLLRRWRDGVGFDTGVPGDSLLHAGVHASQRRSDLGLRYSLTSDSVASSPTPRLWSLGLVIAPGEDREGERRLILAPQFRLDLDRCLPMPGRAELRAEFSPWAQDYGDAERRPDFADEHVAQMQLHWRF